VVYQSQTKPFSYSKKLVSAYGNQLTPSLLGLGRLNIKQLIVLKKLNLYKQLFFIRKFIFTQYIPYVLLCYRCGDIERWF